GCRPIGGGNSKTFLWGRDSTLATVDETIDWGDRNLMLLEQIDGVLVGVSFTDTVSSASVAQTRVTFRYYDGTAGAIEFETFTGFSASPAIEGTLFKQKHRNRVLFPARIPIGSTCYVGVWS